MLRSLVVLSLLSMPAMMVADLTSKSDLVIYTDAMPVPRSRLATSCFENVPDKVRKQCRSSAVERFSQTLYIDKRQCCSRWMEMACLKKYLFNSIYCNQHEALAVHRFFEQILRYSLSENGDCANYPPAKGKRATLQQDSLQCVPRGNL